MFLKMQNFDFYLNLITFAEVLPKFNQICLNLITFNNKFFTKGYGCIPSSYV